MCVLVSWKTYTHAKKISTTHPKHIKSERYVCCIRPVEVTLCREIDARCSALSTTVGWSGVDVVVFVLWGGDARCSPIFDNYALLLLLLLLLLLSLLHLHLFTRDDTQKGGKMLYAPLLLAPNGWLAFSASCRSRDSHVFYVGRTATTKKALNYRANEIIIRAQFHDQTTTWDVLSLCTRQLTTAAHFRRLCRYFVWLCRRSDITKVHTRDEIWSFFVYEYAKVVNDFVYGLSRFQNTHGTAIVLWVSRTRWDSGSNNNAV